MKTKVFLSVLLSVLIYGCNSGTQPNNQTSTPSTETVSNPYLQKYAGGYSVEIKGINASSIDGYVEAYILGASGQAKWMMIKKERDGSATAKQEQTGKWTATETKISITASGVGTEPSTEEFDLVNGTFINTQTDTNIPLSKRRYRYLKLMVAQK